LHSLRKLDDTVRARPSKDLALQIRQLPFVPNKVKLAATLAGLSTEGDFGRDTLVAQSIDMRTTTQFL
jgi:hypothetical protein